MGSFPSDGCLSEHPNETARRKFPPGRNEEYYMPLETGNHLIVTGKISISGAVVFTA